MKGWLLGAALVSLCATAQGADTSYFAGPVSCSSGPYALKLPQSYEALRRIGELREDRVLPTRPGMRPHADAELRELVFQGLRLSLLRPRLDPQNYRLLSAELTRGSWKIAGPFRVGALLPPRVGDVDTRQLRGRGIVEFIGETHDVVRMRRRGRRISTITYLCNVG